MRSDDKPWDAAAIFNDPLAANVRWTRLGEDAASFRTHELCVVSDALLEFRPSWGATLFALSIALGGVLLAFGFLETVLDGGWPMAVPVAIGGGFAFAGIQLLRASRARIGFDLSAGRFIKAPYRLFGHSVPGHDLPLSEVHALQMIAVQAGSPGDTFSAYELNLVLKDGSRVCVISHGDGNALQADAVHLASSLRLPLWQRKE